MKRKKLANPETTNIVFLLDQTGSMLPFQEKTISAFNEYLETVKSGIPGARFTLTKFNSGEKVTSLLDEPISKVPPLTSETYKPDNLTPLYDAIGLAIAAAKTRIGAGKCLFIIFTDGQENDSKEWKRAAIFQLIREMEEKYGWKFAYLGANQDSWLQSEKIGVTSAMNYKTDNMAQGMGFAASASLSYSRIGAIDYHYEQGKEKK